MTALLALPDTMQPRNAGYEQLTTYFDERHGIAWGYMHSEPRPCFTPRLLGELTAWCHELARQIDDPKQPEVHYQVTASACPGVFNLGGDLNLFHDHILRRDREGLARYAKACIEPLYLNIVHLSRPNLRSICLVQGDALGGGFECALSANVLIAEKGSKMGFPEILFNLFPGMGALSLLGRRVGMQKAEQMILSGNLYSAETLYEMGVVDILAEPGEGAQAVYDYARRDGRARNGALALRAAREALQPITYDDLLRVTEIWVDAALRIETKDLRMMERLIARQGGKLAQPSETVSVPARARLAG
jgi:DSF synthase